jgi:hypothetical protein
MKVEDLVSVILEDEGDSLPGALFYFDGMATKGYYVSPPEKGDILAKIVDIIAKLRPALFASNRELPDADRVIEAMMNQYNLIVALNFENEIAIYSKNSNFNLPEEFNDKLKYYFGATPETEAVWFTTLASETPIVAKLFKSDQRKKDSRAPSTTPNEDEPEVPIASLLGVAKPADLATAPWSLSDLKKVGARGKAKPLSYHDRADFRGHFWGPDREPMTGDLDQLGY